MEKIIEFLNKDLLINQIIFISIKIFGIVLLYVLLLLILKKIFLKLHKKDNLDSFRLNFIKKILKGFLLFLSLIFVFYQIPAFKTLAVTIFASSGVLAIIIGFASQEAFSNIVSGIFIILFRPFEQGNVVKITSSNIVGTVEDITLRHTIIKTFENKRIIVPNAVINSEVIENADLIDKKVCRFFDLGISYDSSIDLAISIIKDEIKKHPNHIDVRTDEEKADNIDEIIVKVIGYGESSINLRTWLWGESNWKSYQMACDLYKSIKERFDNENIEIPYPYRKIIYKKEFSDSQTTNCKDSNPHHQ